MAAWILSKRSPFALSKVTACIPTKIKKTALERAEDRSPALTAGPGFNGMRAFRAHSEGRRTSVEHWCGVRRPAHIKSTPRNKSGYSKTSP